MSAAEVIAEALAKHHPTRGMAVAMGVTCACGEWRQGGRRAAGSDGLDPHRAEAVLAAIRAMSPAQQAEVIGGRVWTERPGGADEQVRGPWREVQP